MPASRSERSLAPASRPGFWAVGIAQVVADIRVVEVEVAGGIEAIAFLGDRDGDE